jgi:hypothetical protein
MRLKHTLLGTFFCVLIQTVCVGQPANDDFANRIALTGTSISFTGSVDGATIEAGEDYSYCSDLGNGTVWWSWTALESSQVTLYQGKYDPNANGGVHVLVGTNFNDLTTVACTRIDWIPYRAAAFLASAGETYNIRLVGQSIAPFVFGLVASNAPIILNPPQSRTVSSNEPVLFTVVAGGVMPLTYQWMHSGTNLPGETTTALVIKNANANTTGEYSVVVSNVTGSVLSQKAHLHVSESVIRPHLAVVAPENADEFAFSLAGEAGRAYRIESSTNLVAWTPMENWLLWPAPPFYSVPSSVVINSNVASTYSVPFGSTKQFFRAVTYDPHTNDLCRVNLKHIMLAKHQWARETHVGPSATPSEVDIAPYFKLGTFAIAQYGHLDSMPSADFGMVYTINAVDTVPNCQIVPVHDWLEEPLY